MGDFNRGPRRNFNKGNFNRGGGGFRRSFGPREMHKAVCSECGEDCEVPFKPTEGRAVYCKECFRNRNRDGFGSSEDTEDRKVSKKSEEKSEEAEEKSEEAEEKSEEAEENSEEPNEDF